MKAWWRRLVARLRPQGCTALVDAVAVLELKADDVVLLQCAHALSVRDRERLDTAWKAVGIPGRIVVIDCGLSLAAVLRGGGELSDPPTYHQLSIEQWQLLAVQLNLISILEVEHDDAATARHWETKVFKAAIAAGRDDELRAAIAKLKVRV